MASNKNLDTEVNLVPFISLLSVLICALLLSAVWVQMASLDVKQSVGSSGADIGKQISLWTRIDNKGSLKVSLKNSPRLKRSIRRKITSIRIPPVEGLVDYETFKTHVHLIKENVPDLKMGMVQPSAEVLYDDMIQVMDTLRSEEVVDLGVVPL